MSRVSYKPLLERFNIPRPTLIEWQKHPKSDEKNWRVGHIEYLREQVDVECETKSELKQKAILTDELFYICVYLFLTNSKEMPKKSDFKKNFKEFLFNPKKSLEYQHDFAKRIWRESVEKDAGKYSVYTQISLLIDNLSAFQYYVLVRLALRFNTKLYKNENLSCSKGLEGKTWQELYMYDKEFSAKKIEEYFKNEGVI